MLALRSLLRGAAVCRPVVPSRPVAIARVQPLGLVRRSFRTSAIAHANSGRRPGRVDDEDEDEDLEDDPVVARAIQQKLKEEYPEEFKDQATYELDEFGEHENPLGRFPGEITHEEDAIDDMDLGDSEDLDREYKVFSTLAEKMNQFPFNDAIQASIKPKPQHYTSQLPFWKIEEELGQDFLLPPADPADVQLEDHQIKEKYFPPSILGDKIHPTGPGPFQVGFPVTFEMTEGDNTPNAMRESLVIERTVKGRARMCDIALPKDQMRILRELAGSRIRGGTLTIVSRTLPTTEENLERVIRIFRDLVKESARLVPVLAEVAKTEPLPKRRTPRTLGVQQ